MKKEFLSGFVLGMVFFALMGYTVTSTVATSFSTGVNNQRIEIDPAGNRVAIRMEKAGKQIGTVSMFPDGAGGVTCQGQGFAFKNGLTVSSSWASDTALINAITAIDADAQTALEKCNVKAP